ANCRAKTGGAPALWISEKTNFLMAQCYQVIKRRQHRIFEVEIDKRQIVQIAAATNHHEGVVVLTQEIHPPVIQADLQENHPIHLIAPIHIQQRIRSELRDEEVQVVLLGSGS